MNELMRLIDEECKKPIASFDKSIEELWTSGRFSDFTIATGTREFKVHKSILGIRNSVFAKIIEDHREASEIKINDFSSNSVEALLHFIYNGEIQSEDNASENFSIADKFKVTMMKSAYEEILTDEINEENAFEIFTLAHQHSADELKKEAFRVVASSFPTEVPEKLMEDPEKLKKLVDIYREYQKIIDD